LEAIFLTSEDIRSQLPDDTKRFEQMDSNFKEVMKNAVDVPNVVEVCSVEGLEDNLREMIGILETCQKSLNEYLDMKKKVFPRFYFVSNVALLDILSNGNNPPAIMPYVSDCYDALSKLIFTEGSIDEAHTMIAKDGEQIELDKPFKIVGAVENWLNDLTKAMKDCLRDILSKGLEAASTWGPENPRHGWLFQFPAQVVLQTSLIDWTEVTENSLDELVNGATKDIECFYCMDITKVLHNRGSSWDSWDGHGDVDVVNCIHCVGNDKFVAVRHHESAQKEYPGILGRGASNDSNFLKEAAEGAIKAGIGKL
jgi:dynein heavy chain